MVMMQTIKKKFQCISMNLNYPMPAYKTSYDSNSFIHILEDNDLICSLPPSKLGKDISKDYSLKEIKELAYDSSLKVCFNCKQNINNH